MQLAIIVVSMNKTTILPFDEFIFNGKIKNRQKVYEISKDTTGYFYNITGKGTMTFSDGSIYNGNVVKGKFHGTGRLTYPNCEQSFYEVPVHTQSFYEGQWKEGIQNGFGVYKHPYGWICKGIWTNGILNGTWFLL
jgi:hypothetical protein